MPELPEVEALARDLRETVVGRTITEAWVSPDAPRLVQAMTVAAFTTGLRARAIDGVSRRGKYLMIALDRELWWVLHRRMSGNLLHRQHGDPDEPFLRARFRLGDGSELRFVDLRKFGTMWLTDDAESIVAHLGPEPLDVSFTDDVLRAVLKKRSAPVKAVLLDQGAIAGIGNLYADEALHYARIHPTRRASSLRKDEVSALRKGIVDALEQGLRNLGSSVGHVTDGEEVSLRDHVNLNGKAGGNQEYLVAYGREGRPCRTCGTAIERTKIGQRSAHYCPRCQRKPRARR
ncbi:MAG: bifunctional DNA-formamidopyrimidine glycosylase/DNA-(apurinic or apyrimidinic site) lyase [Dehalococcoidia bacterium]